MNSFVLLLSCFTYILVPFDKAKTGFIVPVLYPVPNTHNNASLSFHKWQCKCLLRVDITVAEIMYSPVRGIVNTPVLGSYALPLLSHTLSNTTTSLSDVLNDVCVVNDAVNAGLSCCLPGSEIFMNTLIILFTL